jgi:iron complex transport system substrate-binding protein
MNGHPKPRRTAARPSSLPFRQNPLSLSLALLLLALLLVSLSVLAGCGGDATGAETTTTAAAEAAPTTVVTAGSVTSVSVPAEGFFPVKVGDDKGNVVTIEAKPMRIVSTAPSNTEILFALGVGDRVVGVSSLDDYPPEVADIDKVGDYQPNTEAVMALSPDLVVGYSGNAEALTPVSDAGAAVLIFDPANIDGIYDNIVALGAATGATPKATELIESIKAKIKEVSEAAAATGDKPRVFYAVDNTLWTCGPGSFVDEMLTLANCINVGSEVVEGVTAQDYYQLSPEQLVAADPDLILLPSSSGYASADEFTADTRFAGLTAVKEGRVYLFDDKIVTRPGPRVGEGLMLLAKAVHPGAF